MLARGTAPEFGTRPPPGFPLKRGPSRWQLSQKLEQLFQNRPDRSRLAGIALAFVVKRSHWLLIASGVPSFPAFPGIWCQPAYSVLESARPFPFGWHRSGFCGEAITLAAYRKRRAQFPCFSRDLVSARLFCARVRLARRADIPVRSNVFRGNGQQIRAVSAFGRGCGQEDRRASCRGRV